MQETYSSKLLILGVWDLCSFSAKLDLGISGTRFVFVVTFYELIGERGLHSALLLQIFSWDIIKTCDLKDSLNVKSFKINILMMLHAYWAEKLSEVAFSTKSFLCFLPLFPTPFTTSSLFLNCSLNCIFLVICFRVYIKVFRLKHCEKVKIFNISVLPTSSLTTFTADCLGSAQGIGKGSLQTSEYAS